MKKFVLFGALLACSMAVGAEVRVDSLNRLVLDGFKQLQPQDSVGVIPHSISANQDFPIFNRQYSLDPKAKMCVLGNEDYAYGGYITFGDNDNVLVGSGTYLVGLN